LPDEVVLPEEPSGRSAAGFQESGYRAAIVVAEAVAVAALAAYLAVRARMRA
jgi:hypothetical protein